MPKLKIILPLVAVFGLALFLGFRPQPLLVELELAERGDVVMRISAEGRSRVRDRYLLRSPLTGTMTRLDRQAGDRVAAGDELLRIYASQAASLDARQQARAEAGLAAAPEPGFRVCGRPRPGWIPGWIFWSSGKNVLLSWRGERGLARDALEELQAELNEGRARLAFLAFQIEGGGL